LNAFIQSADMEVLLLILNPEQQPGHLIGFTPAAKALCPVPETVH
jgi:hypothetical protein